MGNLNEMDFKEKVYDVVRAIPAGSVLTYGTVAFLAGCPQNARQAGKIISQATEGVPAHRVVNHSGRTAPGWTEQRALLEAEGVAFKENGCVNLKKHLWQSTGAVM